MCACAHVCVCVKGGSRTQNVIVVQQAVLFQPRGDLVEFVAVQALSTTHTVSCTHICILVNHVCMRVHTSVVREMARVHRVHVEAV
jgi:hypothetical protein